MKQHHDKLKQVYRHIQGNSTQAHEHYLPLALACLWIGSGLTSLLNWHQQSMQLLQTQVYLGHAMKLMPLWLQHLIYQGSAIWDLFLGLWLLFNKRITLCYLLQLLSIIGYSIIATAGEPSLWLDPMAPLLKNIPILATTYFLFIKSKNHKNHNNYENHNNYDKQ